MSSPANTPSTTISFAPTWSPSKSEGQNQNAPILESTLIVGKTASIRSLITTEFVQSKLDLDIPAPILESMMSSSLKDKTGGGPVTTQVLTSSSSDDNHPPTVHTFQMAALPSNMSRHNHPMAVHALTKLVRSAATPKTWNRLVILTDDFPVGPLGLAVGKAFSLFNMKNQQQQQQKQQKEISCTPVLHTVFVTSNGSLITDPHMLQAATVATKGAQLTARIVDSHPELMTTTTFSQEVHDWVDAWKKSNPEVDLSVTEIVGDELAQQGYGGLYGVGKAATCPPRLVKVEYNGGGDDDNNNIETVALVGKGIVFDTGGLSLKPKVGMCGMKMDCGGAAGLLGGFMSAVELKVKKKVILLLCLAENAIGPLAVRNDDILTMYSGKTVEVNNADAEGRLVLGDGVAHASKHIPNLDLIVDMATLTGAQLVATGKKHAAILCNKAELEGRFFDAGRYSGDLCYPIVYMPENLMDEFKSEVADMKNSVKDRGNAQTSCAGHFIESHLDEAYEGGWVHVDMAGPSFQGDRGTGYGVGLVLSILQAPGF